MPAGVSAYTALANVTLGSTAASVTFSSISQSYRDLVLVIQATTSPSGDNTIIRFNSDSGNNYNIVMMSGDGSTTTSQASSNQTSGYLAYSGATDPTLLTNDLINIMDYSATDKHKSFLVRDNNPYATQALAQRWASTAAITSILVKPNTDIWKIGSTFALYGVSA